MILVSISNLAKKKKKKPSFMDRFLYQFQQKGQIELTHISTLRKMRGK